MVLRVDTDLFCVLLLHAHVLSGGRIVTNDDSGQLWPRFALRQAGRHAVGNLIEYLSRDGLAIDNLCSHSRSKPRCLRAAAVASRITSRRSTPVSREIRLQSSYSGATSK